MGRFNIAALTTGDARAYPVRTINLERECTSMFDPTDRHRRLARHAGILATVLVASVLAAATANAQATQPAAAPAPGQPATRTTTLGGAPDLQGLWDFTMQVGERTSPGFLALGPVEGGWAGSITLYLTNTLAIPTLTVTGDSVRMVVASREGDVRFLARLSDDGRRMEGIVEYHGGARLPMTAVRRIPPVVPR